MACIWMPGDNLLMHSTAVTHGMDLDARLQFAYAFNCSNLWHGFGCQATNAYAFVCSNLWHGFGCQAAPVQPHLAHPPSRIN